MHEEMINADFASITLIKCFMQIDFHFLCNENVSIVLTINTNMNTNIPKPH